MPDTFDPRPLAGGPACVQALRELDIRVSQRLGARLVALARRGIQLSLALLEAAPPGSDLEARLLADDLLSAAEPGILVASWPISAATVLDDGTLKIVAPDEVDGPPTESSPPPPETTLARALPLTPRAPADPLWSRERLEQATQTFLDSEDPVEQVENLRYLVRASLAGGQDPVPLLVAALRRLRPKTFASPASPLALEVAALTRAHLDRDLGRALEDIYGDDPSHLRDGVYYLLDRCADGRHGTATSLAIPAVTSVLAEPQALRHALACLPQATRLIPPDPEITEAFLEGLMDGLDDLEAPERFALSRFLLDLQGPYPAVVDYLFRRMRGTRDPQMLAFYGNVLSRMRLQPAQTRECVDLLVEAFLQHGQDTAFQKRLESTFLNLGPAPLAILSERSEGAAARAFVADLWAAYLAADAPRPGDDVLAGFVVGEIGARNRAAAVGMLRSGLIRHPAVLAYLQDNEWARPVLLQVLLEEAVRLEDPDDAALFEFLGTLGAEAVEAAFDRAREEAALDSRAAPYRFRIFANVAAAAQAPATDAIADRARQALAFPFLRLGHLPATIDGLGALGRVRGLDEESIAEVLALLLPEAAAETPSVLMARGNPASMRLDAFPEQRMRAVMRIHPGAPASVRDRIESRLEGIVADEATPRNVLVAALDALERLAEAAEPPLHVERIAVTLARIVFRKSREASLDNVLKEMLSDTADGLGVRPLEAWSKEDRDHALVILGRVAGHPRVPDELHRMVTARLAGFLDDWLDAQETGANLYLHRDTPLWRILLELVRARPSEHSVEAAVHAGLRALEVHRKAPQNFALERREDAQRLLAELILLAPQEPVAVRGSMQLDIPLTALQQLLALATRENPTAARILTELAEREGFPHRLMGRLKAFLAFQRREGRKD